MIEELCNATIGQYIVIVSKIMVASLAIAFLVTAVIGLFAFALSKVSN